MWAREASVTVRSICGQEAMGSRVLVVGAGTGVGNNVLRSLRAGDADLVLIGGHHDRFALRKSIADRHYLVHESTHPLFLESLGRVIERESVDLLIPTSDRDVRVCAERRGEIPCRLFLPSLRTVARCQDKCELAAHLRAHGVGAPITYPIEDLASVEPVFDRFAPAERVWCRVRTGNGSTGAIPVKTAAQARAWIAYWAEMRGVPSTSFTLCEYLPGRDFGCQSLWLDGRLILSKTFERLSYFVGGGSTPSGVSSVAALARTVDEPRVAAVARAAVRATDERATGLFGVDLKENGAGEPYVTEINAGRPLAGTNLLDLTGKHNMLVTCVRLALGEPVSMQDEHDVADECYAVRDFDTLPGIFRADELFEGIHDARRSGEDEA
jgi:carbamoyl-phosphate synthase large subunit